MTETDAERYRKQAEEGRKLAERSANEFYEKSWLHLAEDWIKLAEALVRKDGRSLGAVRTKWAASGGGIVPAPHFCCGERRPLVEKLAELFKDFSQVHDVFLDDPLSLRFVRLFARAKPVVDSFASVLFQVRHHVSRFSSCRSQCVSFCLGRQVARQTHRHPV